MGTDPITREEMVEMFGEAMPVEAINLIWNAPPHKTVAEVRAELRQVAAERAMNNSKKCQHFDLFFGSGGYFVFCADCKAEWSATVNGQWDHSRPNPALDTAVHRVMVNRPR